jgi:hypothetical protein
VLIRAIEGGVSQLHGDCFGYAEAYDAGADRYLGLITSNAINVPVAIDGDSVLVKPEVALDQEAADQRKRRRELEDTDEAVGDHENDAGVGVTQGVSGGTMDQAKSEPDLPKRFFGAVELDPDRLGRDAGRIAEEVLQHLATLSGSRVSVTLEINAEVPEGVAEDLQRIVNENCQVLKFKAHGFEKS